MNIKEAKEEIKNTVRVYLKKDSLGRYTYPLLRQRPLLLIGPPGIGKTAIMEQVAEECGVGLVAYTMTHHTRQSAIGLPRITEKTYEEERMHVTEYTLSEIIASVYDCMERTGKKEGILFIDEVNCVSETLAPVMLQFLQNKMFGNHRVPKGWIIAAAGNPEEYNKSVREFDIVTLDRVRQIPITADPQVWLEYAGEKGVHGAVLAYLRLKRENFYRIENGEEEKRFVTARGWEDLSELIKSYEELGLEITAEQIGQFLRHKKIAGDFAAYYQLYRSYGEDYKITEILEGGLSPQEYARRTEMAQAAGFDERFTVTELLTEGCGSRLAKTGLQERETELLYQLLLQWKESIAQKKAGLQEFLLQKRDSLETKEKMELISKKQGDLERDVLDRLEKWSLLLKKEHRIDPPEELERIRQLFGQRLEERKQCLNAGRETLERALRFVEDSFGEGQEMLLLLTCMMHHSEIMSFISRHGCPGFFQYSRMLLEKKPERELQEACEILLNENGQEPLSDIRIL